VEACGVCHGDAIVNEGRFPGLQYPRIPGHEVVGIIDQLGSTSKNWKVGQRVGIGWHGGHCFQCSACRSGEFGTCENSSTTGITTDGGYAEYMVARIEALTSIPDDIDPCRSRAPSMHRKNHLWSPGKQRGKRRRPGGNPRPRWSRPSGHAVRLQARFRDSSLITWHGKEALARKLGAHHFINTNTSDAAKELINLGGAKVILCTAPNGKAISELVSGLSRNGHRIIPTSTR
jgi:propanol-preferring alcohol dehydrogenase